MLTLTSENGLLISLGAHLGDVTYAALMFSLVSLDRQFLLCISIASGTVTFHVWHFVISFGSS